MTNDKQKDRLVELIGEELLNYSSWSTEMALAGNYDMPSAEEVIADKLLADGWMRPPCKVGDTVYVKYYGEIVNAYVTEFEINSKGIVAKVYIDPDTDREYDAEDLFLTKEEAEAKLKEGVQ